tara:strand:- start:167 stop:406 length:240 start_codon:yes stop_codon:yes gene_type:complete
LKKYGKTKEEKKAEKSIKCREIVSEIVKFGVDESQKLQIIKLLALELENNKSMKKIVNAISNIAENNSNSNENIGLLGL